MVIDKGFYVDNFVGTYRIGFSEEMNQRVIVSNEFNHPAKDEKLLEKKRLFESSLLDDSDVCLKLANIDLDSESSILKYCNQYGLPYSSQLISDKQQWVGADVDTKIANTLAHQRTGQYQRNDLMTLAGFKKEVMIVRKLMQFKTMLDAEQMDCAWYTELISTLIFFLFFSHKHYYTYETDIEEFPRSRAMRFQYEFHVFCMHYSTTDYRQQVCVYLENLRQLQKVEPGAIESKELLADVHSNLVDQVLAVLPEILYERTGNSMVSKNRFFCKETLEIYFENQLECGTPETIDRLRQLGIEVYRSVINEGLGYAAPELVLENNALRGGWRLGYQIQGIYMELFMDATSNFMFRQCANPTCGKFFSASKNRSNKRFCCHECAVLEAKRRERRLKKKQLVKQDA